MGFHSASFLCCPVSIKKIPKPPRVNVPVLRGRQQSSMSFLRRNIVRRQGHCVN